MGSLVFIRLQSRTVKAPASGWSGVVMAAATRVKNSVVQRILTLLAGNLRFGERCVASLMMEICEKSKIRGGLRVVTWLEVKVSIVLIESAKRNCYSMIKKTGYSERFDGMALRCYGNVPNRAYD
jgi:hypothetical protein